MAGRYDVNAIVYGGDNADERKKIQEEASRNIKRVIFLRVKLKIPT